MLSYMIALAISLFTDWSAFLRPLYVIKLIVCAIETVWNFWLLH